MQECGSGGPRSASAGLAPERKGEKQGESMQASCELPLKKGKPVPVDPLKGTVTTTISKFVGSKKGQAMIECLTVRHSARRVCVLAGVQGAGARFQVLIL